jgi:SAM-dependent methyltransferase
VTATDVARYYERNTGRFLRFGRGRGAHAMHRELWGPGVRSAREAVEYVNHLLTRELSELALRPDAEIVDFGCGVGGTLFQLGSELPRARLTGVTVSARQVDTARRLARESGRDDRCSFVLGDFQTVDLGLLADAIVAVESFVHADSPDAFLAGASRHLRRGALLVIVDDFLARDEASLGVAARRQVGRFRSGWHATGLCTAEQLAGAAARHALSREKAVDLTGLTRPGSRLRDRAVAVLGPALGRLGLGRVPFFGNLIGGHALQVGLRAGFLRYGLQTFRKIA